MKPDQSKSLQNFTEGSVAKTVLRNALPAMAAQLILLVYNLADIFFVAQTHNDLMVAAVSMSMPIFLIFMSLGSLFGIGGTSVISRALGAGKREYARRVSAFCMWGCVLVGGVLMALFWIFMGPLLRFIGAGADTTAYAREYLSIVVSCGIFSMISSCFSSIIRAEGKASVAMTGTVLGNVLNIILDPIMITGLGWNIAGAAIATAIGNAAAGLFYLIYFLLGKSMLSISPKEASVKDGICSGVLAIGIPAALTTFLMSISQVIANSRISAYSDLSVAAYGVASKVTMIVGMVGLGVGFGVQPVLGFCYGARNRERFNQVLRFAVFLGLGVCIVCALLCLGFVRPIVQLFLTEPAALEKGVLFTRILTSTAWLLGVFHLLLSTLQAMGAAKASFLVSVCRQGIVYIPAVFLMDLLVGETGIVWAQPVADACSLVLVSVFLALQLRKKEFGSAPGAAAEESGDTADR